jgi:hypothetical protein
MKYPVILCLLAMVMAACADIRGLAARATPLLETSAKVTVEISSSPGNPTRTPSAKTASRAGTPSPTQPASKDSAIPQIAEPTTTPYATLAPLTNEAIAACPVTIPDENTVPEGYSYWGNYGNDALLVPLGQGGKIVPSADQFNADGSLSWKMGMYRLEPGKLTVTGQRLDAPAPPAQGHYDIEGYGDSGFQSGWVYFPSEGCWEITARVAEASLTFVTLVVAEEFILKLEGS